MGYEKEFRFLLQVQSIVSGERSVCIIHHVRLFVTPWTVAQQAPLSMEFSRQEYWCGFPLPTPANDAVKVLHSICQQIWETQQWPWDWKRSVFIPIPKKGSAKEGSNYHTITLISHASKVMLKILQARLQQYVNCELPDVQAGFRKGRGTRDQIANIHCIIEKAREFQKNIYFCFIDYAKASDCVDHSKLRKILQEMGIPDHLTSSWETCMQVRKQQLELDVERQTGSK